MAELKPCECGNKDVELHDDFYPFENPHSMWWVMCRKCKKESRIYTTEQQAIDAWNKRS